jgi:hypothetical protein
VPLALLHLGAVIGVLVAVVVFFAAHLGVMPLWAQILYLAISVLGPIAWTAVGLGHRLGAERRGRRGSAAEVWSCVRAISHAWRIR